VKALVVHHNVCSFNNTVNIFKWLSHSLEVQVFMPIISKKFLTSLKIQESILGGIDYFQLLVSSCLIIQK
jgi:hypothetical protein